jgi:hypothetical protein
MLREGGPALKTLVLEIVLNAMQKAFDEKTIVSSWKDTGVWPLNKGVVRKNALANVSRNGLFDGLDLDSDTTMTDATPDTATARDKTDKLVRVAAARRAHRLTRPSLCRRRQVQETTKKAVSDFIERKVDGDKDKTLKVAKVAGTVQQKDVLFTGEELIAQIEEKERVAAAAAAEKEERKEAKATAAKKREATKKEEKELKRKRDHCGGCSKAWRGARAAEGWELCACGEFRVCHACDRSELAKGRHAKECTALSVRSKRRRV